MILCTYSCRNFKLIYGDRSVVTRGKQQGNGGKGCGIKRQKDIFVGDDYT